MESDTQSQMQTKPKLFCFVLMPFAPEFDDVYQIGITEACQRAGAYCERVDQQIFSERILDRIYNQIAKADIVIADMTGRNANVFYEVGYAHALGKQTVLLTRTKADIPFDLVHFPHIIYESSLVSLRDQLESRIRWHLSHPNATVADTSFPLDLRIGGVSPDSDDVVLMPIEGYQQVEFTVTIRNRSQIYFAAESYKLGVILGSEVKHFGTGVIEPISEARLEDGRTQHVITVMKSLMPGEVRSKGLHFSFDKALAGETNFGVLRLFTPNGFKDYSFKWLAKL